MKLILLLNTASEVMEHRQIMHVEYREVILLAECKVKIEHQIFFFLPTKY